MDLKSILKTIKLQESNISMILGGIVILILGILVVNYFKNINNPLPPSLTENAASDEINPTEHTVTKGETLWSISQKYLGKGSNWGDIAQINELEAPYTIEVGQKILVPTFEEPPLAEVPETPTTPEVKTTVQTENVITGATYEVVKGDCLWNIAVRAYGDGFKWTSIAKENKLKNPDLIHRGNIFILPR